MTTELRRHVDTITHALFAIKDLCSDPADVHFDEIREEMERFEAAFNVKASVDAFFAFICERDEAGRVVGSKHPTQYLQKKLGLEPREAYDRLARGRDYYGEPDAEETPGKSPATDADLFDAANDAAGGDDAAECDGEPGTDQETSQGADHDAAREAARAEARRKQEEARRNAERVNAEKQRVIRLELDRLVEAAKGARARLQADALAEAPNRSVKDLRATVRRWVEEANRAHLDPANPNAGMEKRSLIIGSQRADGTHRVIIDATASDAALLKGLVDKGLAPNSNMPKDVEDYRTPAQRAYDQFAKALRHFETCEKPTGGGCASVVVSVTLDELADAEPTTKFATNTGIDLDAFDLVRLGMDGTADFVLTVDGATALPLNLYRTERFASLAQKITLLAVQGVCAWAGCTAPLSQTEIHHVVSWLRGGDTNIDNLAALCRTHHRCNNDFMDHRGNTSHIAFDPGTGRAGVKEPGSRHISFNHADAAEHSAVNRIRKRAKDSPHPAPEPPPPNAPPPPREPVAPPPWAKDQDPYPPF